MKIVYMGTPDFAVEPMEALIKAGHEIVLVATQPDKVKGRGQELSFSPVKECAIKYDIPVIQPMKIREAEWVSILKKAGADIFVVAAYGQILSKEILDIPKYGCVNIHASLLPKYRGAAPIQWAILNGEEVTGVTIMKMAEGLDTGDIWSQSSIEISPEDTGDSLFDKLMSLGAELIVETLPLIESGSITAVPQNEDEASAVGKIKKEMGLINWSEDAQKIERYVRGLNSWPSAYTKFNNKILKIWKAKIAEADCVEDKLAEIKIADLSFGAVAWVGKDSFMVKTGKGLLEVTEVQLEGKKRMGVHDFLLGAALQQGAILG